MLYVITSIQCKSIIIDKVHEIIVCKCASSSAWYCETVTCKIRETCQYSYKECHVTVLLWTVQTVTVSE